VQQETGAITESTAFDASEFRNIVPRFSSSARKANQTRRPLTPAMEVR